MEFYELAGETDPFHIQWYRKESDLEVCGHDQLPLSCEIEQRCERKIQTTTTNYYYNYYKQRYKGNEEWLESELCDQWFHEACFEKQPTFITSFFTIL